MKPKTRRRSLFESARRILLTLLAIALLFYWWVPMDYDLRQRRPSGPNPPFALEERDLLRRGARILAVVAHPDDESYYIGGTLTELGRAGAEITLVVCTYGDKGYYGPFTDVADNRRVRKREADTVAKALGAAEVRYLGFTDGRLRNDRRVREAVRREIVRIRPDVVLTFDDLYPTMISHRDHRRCGEAVVAASRAAGFQGLILRFASGGENYWNDISDVWEDKVNLLSIHRSQFEGEKLERVKATLMETAMEAAEKIDVTYAEGFRVTRER